MREIKFRAWIDESDLCNREELHNHLTDNNEFIPFMQDLNDWYFDDGQTLGGYFSNFGIGNVMQYTGLKDKDGIELYEGDIVKMTGHKPGTYTVIWDSYRVAWWLKNIKKREKEYDDDYCQLLGAWQEDAREVIGNIYENSELLEEKADE